MNVLVGLLVMAAVVVWFSWVAFEMWDEFGLLIAEASAGEVVGAGLEDDSPDSVLTATLTSGSAAGADTIRQATGAVS